MKPSRAIPAVLRKVHCESLHSEGGYARLRQALHSLALDLNRTIPPFPTEVAEGAFTATGNNSDGEEYINEVEIRGDGGQYEITWHNVDEIVKGIGTFEGATLKVASPDWHFTYDLHADGTLTGEWEQGAFERLVPHLAYSPRS